MGSDATGRPTTDGDGSTDGSDAPSPRLRLAVRTADQIASDIADQDLPAGEVIASEAALLDQHGVSRGVLRQAVRLLEHQGLVRMRRGPGGGLGVQQPSATIVVKAVGVHVFRRGIDLHQLYEARRVVEGAAAELAASRLDESGLGQLQDLLAEDGGRSDRLHRMLGRMAGNPVLRLFVDVFSRLTDLYDDDSGLATADSTAASQAQHAEVAEAVLAGNGGLARHLMASHLDAVADELGARSATARFALAADLPTVGQGEIAASRLLGEIVAAGWPVGEVMGSEVDLMDRHQLSRSALREGVRILEFHGIATMRPGPGGGLTVTEPALDIVGRSAATYLEGRDLEVRHLAELRVAVETAMIGLTIERLDDQGAEHLQWALEAESAAALDDFAHVGHDLHVLLAELTGNPALEVMAKVLAHLTQQHQIPATTARRRSRDARLEVVSEVHRAHEAIVEAVLARDPGLAKHRRQRHLDAMSATLT